MSNNGGPPHSSINARRWRLRCTTLVAALLVMATASSPVHAAGKKTAAAATSGAVCSPLASVALNKQGQQLTCVRSGSKLQWLNANSTPNGSIKAAESGAWINATGNLAGLKSECGNLTLMASHPRKDMLIVGVAQQGLWTSEDGATEWTQLGGAAKSVPVTNRPSSILFDPVDQNVFWESGIYNGGGVYRTVDNGKTFAQLGDVTHMDVVSVDLADPAHKTLVATTHEKSQPWQSVDGGLTWTDVSANLPSGVGFTSNALVINATTQLLGSQNPSGGAGVFRTTTGGNTWTRVYDKGVWGQPLRSTSDNAIYWLVQFGGGLIKSSDDGVTWRQVVGPDIFSSSPGSSSNLVELPDGRLGAIGREQILMSKDHGTTWKPVGRPLPFNAWGLIYSSSRSSFYIWHWDCGPKVLSDAIMRLPFDYRKN